MMGPSAPNGPPVPIATADAERLEERHARADARAVDQDGLKRLRNAVAANFVGPIARHQADNDAAHDGHKDRQPVQLVLRRRNELQLRRW